MKSCVATFRVSLSDRVYHIFLLKHDSMNLHYLEPLIMASLRSGCVNRGTDLSLPSDIPIQ